MHGDQRAVTAARARSGYLPGLDGLRAISVIAVLLYHGGMRWLPGGFLGVEVAGTAHASLVPGPQRPHTEVGHTVGSTGSARTRWTSRWRSSLAT